MLLLLLSPTEDRSLIRNAAVLVSLGFLASPSRTPSPKPKIRYQYEASTDNLRFDRCHLRVAVARKPQFTVDNDSLPARSSSSSSGPHITQRYQQPHGLIVVVNISSKTQCQPQSTRLERSHDSSYTRRRGLAQNARAIL